MVFSSNSLWWPVISCHGFPLRTVSSASPLGPLRPDSTEPVGQVPITIASWFLVLIKGRQLHLASGQSVNWFLPARKLPLGLSAVPLGRRSRDKTWPSIGTLWGEFKERGMGWAGLLPRVGVSGNHPVFRGGGQHDPSCDFRCFPPREGQTGSEGK